MQNVEFLTTHGFLNMCLFKSEVNVLSYGRAAMFKNYDLNGHYETCTETLADAEQEKTSELLTERYIQEWSSHKNNKTFCKWELVKESATLI